MDGRSIELGAVHGANLSAGMSAMIVAGHIIATRFDHATGYWARCFVHPYHGRELVLLVTHHGR